MWIRSTRGLSEKTWQTIKAFSLEQRSMVSSFNPFVLRRFNKIGKGSLPTAFIFDESPSIPKIFHHG
jgi:glycerophosphoryl diester phosphodiesterase